MQVGVDPKAVADAWTRIEQKHGDKLAALFVSVDEQKGKALAYAGARMGLLVWQKDRSSLAQHWAAGDMFWEECGSVSVMTGS